MSHAIEFDESVRQPAPSKRRAVLVTGAAGRIGSYFAQHAHQTYDLTLMVRNQDEADRVTDLGNVVTADLADLDKLKDICKGIDTVVHLAADARPTTPWDSLLANNIVGTFNLFQAASDAKCRRVIFASSIHAVSGYEEGVQIKPDSPVNPGDLYGVTKCFGEALGRYMASQRDMSVIAIRIGAYLPDDVARNPQSLGNMELFISHRDMAQLLCRCIDNEDLHFAIVHGVSNNRFNRLDISETRKLLGYQPEDDFTQLNAQLKPLNLADRIPPHNDRRE